MISAYFQRPGSSTIQINIRENLAKGRSRMYTPRETGNIGYILHTIQKNKKKIDITTRVVLYIPVEKTATPSISPQ